MSRFVLQKNLEHRVTRAKDQNWFDISERQNPGASASTPPHPKTRATRKRDPGRGLPATGEGSVLANSIEIRDFVSRICQRKCIGPLASVINLPVVNSGGTTARFDIHWLGRGRKSDYRLGFSFYIPRGIRHASTDWKIRVRARSTWVRVREPLRRSCHLSRGSCV